MPTKYASRGRVPIYTRGPKRPISKHQKTFTNNGIATKGVGAGWSVGNLQGHRDLLEESSTPQTVIRVIGEGNVYSTVTQDLAVAVVRAHDGITPQDLSLGGASAGNIYPSNEDILWSGYYGLVANSEPIPIKFDVKGKRKLKKNDNVYFCIFGSNATAAVIHLSTTIFSKN